MDSLGVIEYYGRLFPLTIKSPNAFHSSTNRHQFYEGGRIIPITDLEASRTADSSRQSIYLELEADDSV